MVLMMDKETSFVYEGEEVTFSGFNISKPLIVSVKENSLIPRDPINDSNMAKELFQMGAIDKEALLSMVNFPNSQEVLSRMAQAPAINPMTPPIQ